MANLNTVEDLCSPWTVADAARIEFNAGEMKPTDWMEWATQPEPAVESKTTPD